MVNVMNQLQQQVNYPLMAFHALLFIWQNKWWICAFGLLIYFSVRGGFGKQEAHNCTCTCTSSHNSQAESNSPANQSNCFLLTIFLAIWIVMEYEIDFCSMDPNLENETAKTRFYPGDLVCYKSNKPFDWTVWYGKIISPQNPLIEQYEDYNEDSKLTFLKRPKTTDWTYEEGLKHPFYVQWTHSNRIGLVNNADDICLIDRELYVGQRVMNAVGDKGSVIGTSTQVAVKIINTSHVIENVNVGALNAVSELVRGREILYRGWIGVIIEVKRLITAQLDNGPSFTFAHDENDGFMKVDPYSGPAFPVPGTRTKFAGSALKKATFKSRILESLSRIIPPLHQYYASSTCTVTAVEASSVTVKWLEQCSTATGTVSEIEPEKTIKKEQFKFIKPLGIPSQSTVRINSIRMYGVQPLDSIISYPAWYSGLQSKVLGSTSLAYQQTYQLPIPSNVIPGSGYQMPVKVIGKETYVEIEWDNGSKEILKGSDIPLLVPNQESDEFPVGLVIQPVFELPGLKKYGIVQFADRGAIGDKTANVLWIADTEEEERLIIGRNNESVYDIKPHEKYCLYQKGTILCLKDNQLLYDAGTVIELDILNGKVILAVPNSKSTHSVWPHRVIPIQKRCYWNFFSKGWMMIEMLPPLYHILPEKSSEILQREFTPVSLNDNNNIVPRTRRKSIWVQSPFEILSTAPEMHRYFGLELRNPSNELLALLRVEIANLKESLPDGIWVRGYENRMDIFSVLILGPEDTPFEDGLYFFDVQVPVDFPARPPQIHHVQYSHGPISPFIAHDGTFCSSKLIWEFSERPSSYIAQALLQVQRIVFTREPYFDIFGKETSLGTSEGDAESRAFNEKIFQILGLLTSSYNMALRPYEPWRDIIAEHLSMILPEKISAVTQWIQLLDAETNGKTTDMDAAMPPVPSFNILPISQGFKLAVTSRIHKLQQLFPARDSVKDEEKEKKEIGQEASGSIINRFIESENVQETQISAETIAVD